MNTPNIDLSRKTMESNCEKRKNTNDERERSKRGKREEGSVNSKKKAEPERVVEILEWLKSQPSLRSDGKPNHEKESSFYDVLPERVNFVSVKEWSELRLLQQIKRFDRVINAYHGGSVPSCGTENDLTVDMVIENYLPDVPKDVIHLIAAHWVPPTPSYNRWHYEEEKGVQLLHFHDPNVDSSAFVSDEEKRGVHFSYHNETSRVTCVVLFYALKRYLQGTYASNEGEYVSSVLAMLSYLFELAVKFNAPFLNHRAYVKQFVEKEKPVPFRAKDYLKGGVVDHEPDWIFPISITFLLRNVELFSWQFYDTGTLDAWIVDFKPENVKFVPPWRKSDEQKFPFAEKSLWRLVRPHDSTPVRVTFDATSACLCAATSPHLFAFAKASKQSFPEIVKVTNGNMYHGFFEYWKKLKAHMEAFKPKAHPVEGNAFDRLRRVCEEFYHEVNWDEYDQDAKNLFGKHRILKFSFLSCEVVKEWEENNWSYVDSGFSSTVVTVSSTVTSNGGRTKPPPKPIVFK